MPADPRPLVHAEVAGTQTYATSVWIEDGDATGSCDCPSGAGGWFCKHQVAVALICRDRLSGVEPTVDEAARRKVQASAKRAQTVRNRGEALQVFLFYGAPYRIRTGVLALRGSGMGFEVHRRAPI